MKQKTNELTGVALDWAVAKCDEVEVDYTYYQGRIMFDTYQDEPPPVNEYNDNRMQLYSPSTDWAQGGAIIEREYIGVAYTLFDKWVAEMCMALTPEDECIQRGNTPLEAAMRCYVASKLGDEVEVPDELTVTPTDYDLEPLVNKHNGS